MTRKSKQARTIGGETYTNFDDKVAAFNNLSKDFAAKYGIEPLYLILVCLAKDKSPRHAVKYFSEYSKGS